ncbi:MAG: hypothetical protein AABY22_18700 [Nanoarchaeota archaeon]
MDYKEVANKILGFIFLWTDYTWYKYLAEKPRGYADISRWKIILCRIRGHPNGVRYMNPGGYEPDMRCKDCGEDLG